MGPKRGEGTAWNRRNFLFTTPPPASAAAAAASARPAASRKEPKCRTADKIKKCNLGKKAIAEKEKETNNQSGRPEQEARNSGCGLSLIKAAAASAAPASCEHRTKLGK